MKKILYLFLAMAFSIGISAQTVSKTGRGTINKSGSKTTGSGSYSSSSSHSHSSSSSSTYSGSSHAPKTSSGTTTSYDRTEKMYDAKPEKKTIAVTEKTEVIRPGSDTKGGITRVGESEKMLLNYEDKAKADANGNSSTGSDGENSTAQDTAITPHKGLSETIKSKNPACVKKIITCENLFTMSHDDRLIMLAQYDLYDLSQIESCDAPYPSIDKFTVTCEEFGTLSHERKMHILAHHKFYNVTLLNDCDAYVKFREDLSKETD